MVYNSTIFRSSYKQEKIHKKKKNIFDKQKLFYSCRRVSELFSDLVLKALSLGPERKRKNIEERIYE